jgi:two-component system sensor histidine kinase KdpD
LPLLLLTAVSLVRGAQAAEERAASERQAATRATALSAVALAGFVNENIDTVRILVGYTGLIADYFSQLVRPFTGTPAAATEEAQAPRGALGAIFAGISAPDVQALITRALATNQEWEDIDIFEQNGTPVGTQGERSDPVPNLADQPYFLQAVQTGLPVISPAAINIQTGRPIVVLIVPTALTTGDRGVVAVALSAERLGEKLRALYAGGTAEAVLVDSEGVAFAQPDAAAATRLPSWRERPEVRAVLAHETGSRRVRGAEGRDLLVAYAPVQVADAGWGVLVYQPAGPVFESPWRQLRTSLVLLILAGGVTAALAWYSAANLSRAAERQAAALASAHRAGQVRDEFLASASHELRTPLSHIKGFASSLRQTDVQWDEETRREFLTEIEDETDRLAKMIGDLLDMSRIESGGMDSPVRVPVMVTALVDGGVDRVRALLRGREIDVDLPADLPPVLADAGLIERVIGNLVENAAKYAPPDRPIRVAAVAEDDAIEVRVEDEGPGIPPEYLEQVFDKFFRVKGAGRSPIPGTGLGLAICRAIIQTHGGRIWAENRSSGGARFIVRLPRAPSAATAS